MSENDKDDASPLASKLLLRKKQMRMTHPSPWKINFHPDDTDDDGCLSPMTQALDSKRADGISATEFAPKQCARV